MAEALKIAIIGDFNFSYNSHHATNLAIEHSKSLLEIEVNYYWIRVHEAAEYKPDDFLNYDAVWLAPGPFENIFFMNGVTQTIIASQLPVLITGDAFKVLVEVLVNQFNINPKNEKKLISDNLAQEEQFEKIEVYPHSKQLKIMYNEMVRTELTATRFSIYPQLLNYLVKEVIDIEAYNQYEDPEIISLKHHPFCVASMSIPQICSTREMPHPLISSFLNFASQINQESDTKTG